MTLKMNKHFTEHKRLHSKNFKDVQSMPNYSEHKYLDFNSHLANSYEYFTHKGSAELKASIESERCNSLHLLKKKKLKAFQNDVSKRVSYLQNLKNIEKSRKPKIQFLHQNNLMDCPLPAYAEKCTQSNFFEEKKTESMESNEKLMKLQNKVAIETRDAKRKLYSKKRKDFINCLPGGLWDATDNKQVEENFNNVKNSSKQNLSDGEPPDTCHGENKISEDDEIILEDISFDRESLVSTTEVRLAKQTSSSNCFSEMKVPESSSSSTSSDAQIIQIENIHQDNLMISDLHKKVALTLNCDDLEKRDEQKQQVYWKCRKMFMQLEREKVKMAQSQQNYTRKIKLLKLNREKERELLERQQKMETANIDNILMEDIENFQKCTSLNDEQPKKIYKQSKELESYMEAVREVAKKRISLSGISLPPLCQCGPTIWDAHPDTCANNCIFYKNPKVYIKFLTAALANTR
ncbi:uncharacterized protein LOC100210102 isoform X1 [Hydra vulgaris]|uniref:uncharacterized protein LOC100210102 isoform X1 n=1 Tax=Hydra vulgaris TaxID=6087 RepID=UPI001F5FC5B6|nr:uncharacterized protein LOC100210102 [Hydra vulgaris]